MNGTNRKPRNNSMHILPTDNQQDVTNTQQGKDGVEKNTWKLNNTLFNYTTTVSNRELKGNFKNISRQKHRNNLPKLTECCKRSLKRKVSINKRLH